MAAIRFRLAEVLEEQGLSQRQLAIRAGVSPTTVNALAQNKPTMISLATLESIAEVLKMSPLDLMEIEGRTPKRRKAAAR